MLLLIFHYHRYRRKMFMKRFVPLLEIVILLFLISGTMSVPLFGEEKYKLEDMGTLSSFRSARCFDINDRGQALLCCYDDSFDACGSLDESRWCIWDGSWGLIAIDVPYGNLELGKITNSGEVVVTHCEAVRDDKGHCIRRADGSLVYDKAVVVWNAVYGFRSYDLGELGDNSSQCSNLAKGHCADRIVGTYIRKRVLPANSVVSAQEINEERIFVIERGRLRDFAIDEAFRVLGYDMCGLAAIAVNEHGDILGSFRHWQTHPFKESVVASEPNYFLWRGGVLHILDFPDYAQKMCALDVNNSGEVLVSMFVSSRELRLDSDGSAFGDYCCGVWSYENGLSWVGGGSDVISSQISLFDSLDLLYGPHSSLRLKDDSRGYRYLQADEMRDLCCCDRYPGIRFEIFLGGNRSGQVVVFARFMGEYHPFLLTPIQ